jgi:hypothetical protein
MRTTHLAIELDVDPVVAVEWRLYGELRPRLLSRDPEELSKDSETLVGSKVVGGLHIWEEGWRWVALPSTTIMSTILSKRVALGTHIVPLRVKFGQSRLVGETAGREHSPRAASSLAVDPRSAPDLPSRRT